MQLSEIEFGNAKPIEGYGPDFYRLDGQTHAAPVLIYGGEVHPGAAMTTPPPFWRWRAGWMCCWSAPARRSRICPRDLRADWTQPASAPR